MPIKNIPRPHILVVDDEDAVRSLVRRMLEPAGYIVEEAANPFQAVEMAEQKTPIDLLVADYRMPDMTGGEVARRIRTQHRQVRVLFVTGYPDDLFDERHALWEGESFLEKPFSKKALLEAASLLLFGKLHQEQLFEPAPGTALRDPQSWGFAHSIARVLMH